MTLCRSCGERIGCDFCDTAMIEHRFQKRLMCHQCGETKQMPTSCPNCKVMGNFAPIGPGVERLAEEAAKLFQRHQLLYYPQTCTNLLDLEG